MALHRALRRGIMQLGYDQYFFISLESRSYTEIFCALFDQGYVWQWHTLSEIWFIGGIFFFFFSFLSFNIGL